MVLLSHPTGNTFVRALLRALHERGSLAQFFTTLSISSRWVQSRIVPQSIRRELMRREYALPGDFIRTNPWLESMRLISERLKIRPLIRHETGCCSVDAVYRDLDRFVSESLRTPRAGAAITRVYCYEDCALETFRAAKALGIRCVYELPIAYWKTSLAILTEEAARLPAWAGTLTGAQDSQEKFDRKSEELELADVLVAPSQFVLDSVPFCTGQQRVLAPFGSPPVSVSGTKGRKFRVLFAGSMSQRKGLADLFAAIRLLNHPEIELVVLGAPVAPMAFYRSQFEKFTHERTRPHQQVLELMAGCDVLVLPSLVEGRALVQQEAMMCGLPLIVTPNTGGDDLIVNGETGFLVPIRSPEAIAARLEWMVSHREKCREMGESARGVALKRTWKSYSDAILQAIEGDAAGGGEEFPTPSRSRRPEAVEL